MVSFLRQPPAQGTARARQLALGSSGFDPEHVTDLVVRVTEEVVQEQDFAVAVGQAFQRAFEIDRVDRTRRHLLTCRPTLGARDVPALLWRAATWSAG